MKFDKDFLVQNEVDYKGSDQVKIIYNKIIDHTRWSVIHEVVFKFNDKFYKTTYSIGATEMQDNRPWDYEDPEVKEVKPEERKVIFYVPMDE
jgi:hypothetical protein